MNGFTIDANVTEYINAESGPVVMYNWHGTKTIGYYNHTKDYDAYLKDELTEPYIVAIFRKKEKK